jgi:hypothetical protein
VTRLLLILALIVASAGFGPAAGARAEQPATHHHHGAAHQHGDHGDSQEQGNGAPTAIHVCPGCAMIGQPAIAALASPPAALPRLPANPPSLRSFDAHPIPPPPRPA